MRIFGQDDGYGEIKVVGDGGQACLASLIRSGAWLELGDGGRENAIYHTEDQPFTIGDGMNVLNTRFDGYERSAINRVLSMHALLSQGFEEGDTVVTGLPIRVFFRADGTINKEAVQARRDSLQIDVRDARGEVLPKPGKVQVMAQGLAALMALEESNVAILDVGARTMDAAVFQNGQILMERTGGRNLGVLDMQQRFAGRIAGKFTAYPLPDHMIYRAFREGHIRIMGKDVDLEADRGAAIKEVAQTIWQEAMGIFHTVEDVDRVLLIGGGAGFLGAPYPHVVVADNPVYANAKGMYLYGNV